MNTASDYINHPHYFKYGTIKSKRKVGIKLTVFQTVFAVTSCVECWTDTVTVKSMTIFLGND